MHLLVGGQQQTNPFTILSPSPSPIKQNTTAIISEDNSMILGLGGFQITPRTNKNGDGSSPAGISESKKIQSAREFTTEGKVLTGKQTGDTPHFSTKPNVPLQKDPGGLSPRFKHEAKSAQTSSQYSEVPGTNLTTEKIGGAFKDLSLIQGLRIKKADVKQRDTGVPYKVN